MRDDRQSAGDDQDSRRDSDPARDQPPAHDGRGAGNSPVGGGPDRRASGPDQSPPERERAATRSDRHGPDQPSGANQSDGPGWVLYVWDLASSIAIVAVIGALLFTASGIWPPMVAVESASMEPVMEKGDLVFIMEGDRFPGPNAHETGIVTARAAEGSGYTKFDAYGDVIVFEPDGSKQKTPVIHRAMFWVEEGEDWSDKADPAYLAGNSECAEGSTGDRIPNCPAPHSGFITKGDANPSYDQVNNIASGGPIKPQWIVGTAEFSAPYLGNIRLSANAASATNTTAG